MKMTLTRALAELKMLDKRIQKTINDGRFIESEIGNKGIRGYHSPEEFKTTATSSHDSILAMIHNRSAIKSALVKANAETIVTIGKKDYTLAEAIEKKNGANFELIYLHQLKRQYNDVSTRVEKENLNVQHRLDTMLETQLGRDRKTDPEETKELMKLFQDKNGAKLHDPLKIRELIEKLETENDAFITEVDYVLSEINAKTEIEVMM